MISHEAALERQTLLERAYELAASGTCATVSDVARRLSAEGYADPVRALYGPVLKADLRRLCQSNFKAEAAD
jgi:hypothetical protein